MQKHPHLQKDALAYRDFGETDAERIISFSYYIQDPEKRDAFNL